jgi:hypothetical protein
MVTHMKTTIEISDALLRAAKRSARARGLTLRALVEEGLRRVLRDEVAATPFRLRRASFKGKGTAAGVRDWDAVRELIYPGRGE